MPLERAEEARAVILDLFPEGFEEVTLGTEIELAAYTHSEGATRLSSVLGRVETAAVEPGWEESWRRFHCPVRVGPLWIGPPWERPERDALPVVIDPGRAFGTGAHPTTRLCLELLLGRRRTSFLDLGCGSGVLAVAAATLGFAPVVALDADSVAVEATRANAVANGVELEVRRADVLADPLPEAGLAVANVDVSVAARLGPRVEASWLVTSGYLAAERPAPAGWEASERRVEEGWAADLFVRG